MPGAKPIASLQLLKLLLLLLLKLLLELLVEPLLFGLVIGLALASSRQSQSRRLQSHHCTIAMRITEQ